jgi:hypothetical protein
MTDQVIGRQFLDRASTTRDAKGRTTDARIPLWFKLVYTAFCAVLVPTYVLAYGPTNFLYFCDVALLTTLVAIWLESPLLASAPAVGILLPQAFWVIDFLAAAAGIKLTGMTAFMFDAKLPLFTRGLSFFHFWLPFVLAWLVWRLGYDRRAFAVWTVAAWVLLTVCYFLTPAPPATIPNLPVNINCVFGMSNTAPQSFMPGALWFMMLMVGLPAIIFYPTHRLLLRYAGNGSAGTEVTER